MNKKSDPHGACALDKGGGRDVPFYVLFMFMPISFVDHGAFTSTLRNQPGSK